jgi:uncharacterized protein YidB (DUF937 family)
MASQRMTALLAMLAMAGYQNRDKLGEIFGRITGQIPSGSTPDAEQGSMGSASAGGLGGLLGGLLGGGAGSPSGGGSLSGGLSDLISGMSQNGQGEAADSWVRRGPNKELDASQLEQGIGTDALAEIAAQTGLPREELLARLKSVLPAAVDKLTPEGRLPTEAETLQWKV